MAASTVPEVYDCASPGTDRVRAHYEQLTQSLFTKHADRYYAHPNRRIRDGSTEQMLASAPRDGRRRQSPRGSASPVAASRIGSG
jgi:hypothetical protein